MNIVPELSKDQVERIMADPKKDLAKILVLTPKDKEAKAKIKRANLKIKPTMVGGSKSTKSIPGKKFGFTGKCLYS